MGFPDPTQEDVFDYGLYLLDKVLTGMGKRLIDYPPMPLPLQDWNQAANVLLQDELNHDYVALWEQVETNLLTFNAEQRNAYDAVMQSVQSNQGQVFFLHSAGGGGKTYVCNTIAASVRSQGKAALCVASSGIASLLLDGGRTAHSRFKIPIEGLNERSSCSWEKNSDFDGLIHQTGVVIWDEAPMQHRYGIEAVDRTLQDLMGNPAPFGGVTVLTCV
ncbi:hypothetical protein HETIRDRAFT_455741 [Heterobasidion irregulare TC 32-1]|uniref:ATP-dependent DNA helicase n=1 Tax=Heterobasidion irregulare (strain TC 32-1) TaxID=747525 RepID=W4JRW4_HETIT|nr:uncharacterized protein HETIRDRAFT_455741 [Heterobasidion irregulare TC 32-1]ETW76214.1 hypothetical protein HETIRDRAFT_455741 [Heterobasidion irregulare TC 32-1]